VTAARSIFERDGFLDARITDITAEANVASGTFYTYFDDKEAIFAAVIESLEEDMLHMHIRERVADATPYALICAANEEYLKAYQRNARLMAALEQVAQIDEHFRNLRSKRSDAFLRRNAKLIKELQDRGEADPSLDPLVAAEATVAEPRPISASEANAAPAATATTRERRTLPARDPLDESVVCVPLELEV